MHKLIILGTSNCVLKKGFLDGIRANSENEFEITNFSTGASCSLFTLWALLHSDIKMFDNSSFLIDTVVNDEYFESKNILKKSLIDLCYASLGTALETSNSFAIQFSSQLFFDNGSLISKSQECIFSRFGIETISLRRILKKSLSIANEKEQFNRTSSDLYEDGGHFHRHLSYQTGRDLPLCHLFQTNTINSDPRDTLKNLGFFEFIPNNISPIVRSTSLRQENCYVFDTSSEFHLPNATVLYGLAIDATMTRCILNLQYSYQGVECIKEYAAIYSSQSNKLQVKFIHFNEAIYCDHGSLRVSIKDSVLHEESLEFFIHSQRHLVDLTGITLIGILCASTDVFDNELLRNSMKCLSEVDAYDSGRCTDSERNMIRKGKYFNAINHPPDIPHYPRSFIEL